MKKIFLCLLVAVLVLSNFSLSSVRAATTLTPDSVIKNKTQSTLYYYAADGKRYVFPNDKTYFSWFTGFSNIIELNDEELANIPLGGIVHYRPAVLLVKIQTDPKVYAVSSSGVLRWVENKQTAQGLYGDNWNHLIDDISDAIFINYKVGKSIRLATDYNIDNELLQAPTISHGKGLKLGHIKHASDTEKCRAIPAIPAIPAHKQGKKGKATPAIPAISARDCAHEKNENDDDNDNDEDNNHSLLAISSLSSSVSTSTANITWLTNRQSTSSVTYDIVPTASSTSTNKIVSLDSLVNSHTISLTGLTPLTKYYYTVKSVDVSGKIATSTESTFKTLLTVDNNPPVISSITANASTTSSLISWITDEPSTSLIQFAKESLLVATTSQTVIDNSLVTSHLILLNSLNSSTTYNYLVKSGDAVGNLAISPEKTFITLP